MHDNWANRSRANNYKKTPGLGLHVKIMTRQNCPMPKHRIANVYAGLRHLLGISQLHDPAAFSFGKEAA